MCEQDLKMTSWMTKLRSCTNQCLYSLDQVCDQKYWASSLELIATVKTEK